MSYVIEEHFKAAENFLKTLRLTNTRRLSQDREWESRWLFRGQQKAEWKLIPRAWRPGNLDPFQKFKNQFRSEASSYFDEQHFKYEGAKDDSPTYHQRRDNVRWVDIALQQAAELYAVEEFASIANKVGHPVPDGEVAHSHLVKYNIHLDNIPTETVKFLVKEQAFHYIKPNNSTYALAQHHGVPTRLLDWTEDGLMAAFFAAEHVTPDDSYDIAVWALHRDVLSDSSLELVDRPRADISYLHAQKGLFTYDKQGGHYFLKHGQWPDVLSAQIHGMTLEPLQFEHGDLYKLTLPASECGELLRLLWVEGISRAHLMPTYDNVAIALQTRGRWRY